MSEQPVGAAFAATRILEKAGYDVLEATGTEAAHRVIESAGGRVDLLLTDVILADTRGPELASQIRERYPDLTVLYMSGYTDGALARHGVFDPGAAFIEKPFRPREPLQRVWEVLSQRPGWSHGISRRIPQGRPGSADPSPPRSSPRTLAGRNPAPSTVSPDEESCA